jgi:isochorismate hydrolase
MGRPDILKREDTVMVVIDLQQKLLAAMHNNQEILTNAYKLVEFAEIVGIPVIVTEQYPKGLGPTVPDIKNLIAGFSPIEKLSFSATACGDFMKQIEKCSQVMLVGIETHVCICQTALNLVDKKSIHVIADAVSSRTVENHQIGLNKCAQAGCVISSAEAAMYEILKEAGTQTFKSVRHLLV